MRTPTSYSPANSHTSSVVSALAVTTVEKMLRAFAVTSRDEVDVQRLTTEIVHVVEKTLQPEHLTIWVRGKAKRTGN